MATPKTWIHHGMTHTLLFFQKALIIAIAMVFASASSGAADEDAVEVDLELASGDQDGYTNDHAYNYSDRVLLCGQEGYVVVLEFPVRPLMQARRAVLTLPVSSVKKPGRVVLYHLLNFNNGYAETQDFYATAEKIGEAPIVNQAELEFDVTQAVRKDAQGPGGFTSYRLVAADGAEIQLPSFESGKDKVRIKLEK